MFCSLIDEREHVGGGRSNCIRSWPSMANGVKQLIDVCQIEQYFDLVESQCQIRFRFNSIVCKETRDGFDGLLSQRLAIGTGFLPGAKLVHGRQLANPKCLRFHVARTADSFLSVVSREVVELSAVEFSQKLTVERVLAGWSRNLSAGNAAYAKHNDCGADALTQ
jgi:hypothetical protein